MLRCSPATMALSNCLPRSARTSPQHFSALTHDTIHPGHSIFFPLPLAPPFASDHAVTAALSFAQLPLPAHSLTPSHVSSLNVHALSPLPVPESVSSQNWLECFQEEGVKVAGFGSESPDSRIVGILPICSQASLQQQIAAALASSQLLNPTARYPSHSFTYIRIQHSVPAK